MKNYTKIKCPGCESERYHILYPSTLTESDFNPEVIRNNLKNTLDDYRKHSQIVKCSLCRLVYTNPMENILSLLKGYEDVIDTEYLQTEIFRKKVLKEHLTTIEQYKKNGRLLDVGCFAGFFLELAKQNGWKAFGIEPSTWASTYAKKNGIKVIGNTIESTKLKDNSFDVITLWDVIEHLPDPKLALTIIHKKLKKNGYVAFGTPNIDSFFAKILGSRCPFLIRMHLILYSPRTLGHLLKQYGFKVEFIGNYGRVFPLNYFLKRIKTSNKIIGFVIKKITSKKQIADFQIRLNFRDSFILIARKI